MQTLTVTEYSRIHIGDRSDPADLVITDAQALRLERMVETLGIPAFSWHRRYLVPQQFVGVYTLGDLRIEVLPKIDQVAREGSGESEVSQQRTCLLELLHWTRRLPIHAAGLSQLHTRQADLLEIYIHVFAEGLLRELRRGVIRRYQIREENLHVVRGKIRFNEQLRRNAIHAERAYCRYQAFHEDHLHNQVLKAASSLLLRQTRNIDTRRQLKTALLLLDRVSEKPIPLMDLRQLIVDRTLTRYAYLLDIAKVVLTGLAHDIAAGQAVQMAVVFDMNKLFEEAVTVALQHALRDDPTLRVRAQSPNRYMLSES